MEQFFVAVLEVSYHDFKWMVVVVKFVSSLLSVIVGDTILLLLVFLWVVGTAQFCWLMKSFFMSIACNCGIFNIWKHVVWILRMWLICASINRYNSYVMCLWFKESYVILLTCQHWLIISDAFRNASYIFMKFISVSDLLDYINPNHDSKGRDAAAKRRSQVTKVCCRFTSLNMLYSSVLGFEI